MDRIKARDIARRNRRHAERVGRGARGSSSVAGSELRSYSELSVSRPDPLTSFSQVPWGAYSGWNAFEFNTIQFNSTAPATIPVNNVVTYAPLGLGMGVLGESFGFKET